MMSTIQPKLDEPISDELALVQAAKGGDVSAFEELVRRYDRNVFRIAQHITQNRRRGRCGARCVPESLQQSSPVPGAVEILYLARAYCGERSAHAVAAPSSGAHGFARRGCKDRGRLAAPGGCRLESKPRAAVQPGRVAGDFDPHHSRFAGKF